MDAQSLPHILVSFSSSTETPDGAVNLGGTEDAVRLLVLYIIGGLC